MYLNCDQIQQQLNKLSGIDIQRSNLLEIQRLEDIIKKQKIIIINHLYGDNNRFNLDSFLELLAENIGLNKFEIEYYYYVAKQYDYIRSINEKRRAYMTFFGQIQNPNNDCNPCYASAIETEIQRLLDSKKDFLFLCSDDDSFIAEMVKTPNEIILPFGNSIKYSKGEESDRIERGIKLTTDVANALDFPVTLKLRP